MIALIIGIIAEPGSDLPTIRKASADCVAAESVGLAHCHLCVSSSPSHHAAESGIPS